MPLEFTEEGIREWNTSSLGDLRMTRGVLLWKMNTKQDFDVENQDCQMKVDLGSQPHLGFNQPLGLRAVFGREANILSLSIHTCG